MGRKLPENLEALKEHLQRTLAGRIAKVVESYDAFAEENIPEDAKGFAAHHSACKAAVAHAEMLIKLAKWTETAKGENQDSEEIEKLITEAKEALSDMDD